MFILIMIMLHYFPRLQVEPSLIPIRQEKYRTVINNIELFIEDNEAFAT